MPFDQKPSFEIFINESKQATPENELEAKLKDNGLTPDAIDPIKVVISRRYLVPTRDYVNTAYERKDMGVTIQENLKYSQITIKIKKDKTWRVTQQPFYDIQGLDVRDKNFSVIVPLSVTSGGSGEAECYLTPVNYPKK